MKSKRRTSEFLFLTLFTWISPLTTSLYSLFANYRYNGKFQYFGLFVVALPVIWIVPLEKDDLYRYALMYQSVEPSLKMSFVSGMLPFSMSIFKFIGLPFASLYYAYVVFLLVVKYSLYNFVKNAANQKLILFTLVLCSINIKSALLGFRSPLSTYLLVNAYFLFLSGKRLSTFCLTLLALWIHKIAAIFMFLFFVMSILKVIRKYPKLLFGLWLLSLSIYLGDISLFHINESMLGYLGVLIDVEYYDDYLVGTWSSSSDNASFSGWVYRSLIQLPYLVVQILVAVRLFFNRATATPLFHVLILSILLNFVAPLSDISLRLLALPWQIGLIYLVINTGNVAQARLERGVIIPVMMLYFSLSIYASRDYLAVFLKVPLYEIMANIGL